MSGVAEGFGLKVIAQQQAAVSKATWCNDAFDVHRCDRKKGHTGYHRCKCGSRWDQEADQ